MIKITLAVFIWKLCDKNGRIIPAIRLQRSFRSCVSLLHRRLRDAVLGKSIRPLDEYMRRAEWFGRKCMSRSCMIPHEGNKWLFTWLTASQRTDSCSCGHLEDFYRKENAGGYFRKQKTASPPAPDADGDDGFAFCFEDQ